jgi:hypothetical protein
MFPSRKVEMIVAIFIVAAIFVRTEDGETPDCSLARVAGVLGGGTVTKQALQNRPYGESYLRRITYAIRRTLFLENTIHSTVLIGST